MENSENTEVTIEPAEVLINHILAGDAVGAQSVFNDIVAAKSLNALGAQKMDIAQALYAPEGDSADVQIETDNIDSSEET